MEHEERWRPANIGTHVRVQKPTMPSGHCPPAPNIRAALHELPSPTLLICLLFPVFIYVFILSPQLEGSKRTEVSSASSTQYPSVRSALGKQ